MNDRTTNPLDPREAVRVPPHSAEVEQELLGALLLDNNCFAATVSGAVAEADFYRHEHRLIFSSIVSLIGSSRPADVITVFEALQRAGKHEDAGGLAYVNSLTNCVTGGRNAARHAEIVREKALERALIAAADKATALAWQPGSVTDKLDTIAATFAQLERGRMRNAPKSMAELVVSALDRLNAAADGRAVAVWSTGVAPLDQLLAGGLRPGKVYGIAARPSVGKSSAARSIVLNIAGRGVTVLLLSQEMPCEEVVDCALAQLGEIDNERLQTGKLLDDDWSRLSDAAERASKLPLFVDDDGGLTIADIRAKARAVKDLKVLVLDYLQLSTSTLKNATTNDQIAEISKGLKRLALELDIAIVVLSQLNRDVERRADREPILSDLRDSGAIEQDLDTAVLLWTVRKDTEQDQTRLVGWKVEKNRGMKVGRFAMRFRPNVYRWYESSESLTPNRVPAGRGGFE